VVAKVQVLSAVVALLFVSFMVADGTVAEEPAPGTEPFGKEPGSIYLGGTSGLSGLDSLRGYIDSLFYSKWWERYTVEGVAGSEKVIYGDDDRRDIYTLTDPNLLKLAQAAFVIVSGSEISNNGDGTYTLSASPWTTQGGLPLCDSERFAGQLRIGHCSGFLVGEDIVVTAGHCMSTCGTYGFVFGFQQTDSLTAPSLVVPEDDIYFCSEIIDWAYAGDYDHCVVRLDRPVVGRTPIPIRREGLVPDGSPLVVVGHPTVLPMKAAAGAEVKDNRGATPWFQANTDTYGGNSGSMVVNTDTWEIEGILVRGAPDFVYDGGCAASNVVPNSGNPGSGLEFEEISKIETMAHLIPELVYSAGEVDLNSSQYNCADQVGVELRDLDLASAGNHDLLIISSAADSEYVSLTETAPGSALFNGMIETESGDVSKYNGRLQVADGDIITVTYEDADDGTGSPATVQASSDIDCILPVISNVAVTSVGATWVTISFSTGETAQGRIWLGSSCGDYINSEVGFSGTSHQITIGSLAPSTPYLFMVEAVDLAGNRSQDDNGGFCYDVTTVEGVDLFTEQYSAGCDLQGKTIILLPDGSTDFYAACLYDAFGFQVNTDSSVTLSLGDDDFAEVTPGSGRQVLLYGAAYSTVYIGSNGYVTFGEGDTDWSETIEEHLASPPRISAYWDDLDPNQGGRVSYRQLSDRLAVTWDDVPEHSTSSLVSVQLQLFFDGVISLTCLIAEPNDGLIGISAGAGYPVDFFPSDLSGYVTCELVTCYTDFDHDTFGAEGDPGHFEPGPQCAVGASANNLDCDDTDESIYPEAPEVTDDGIDQDCDGVDASCCSGQVGDVNGVGGDVPTIGDISVLVNHLFISGDPLDCYQEGDINQSGGRYPTTDDITVGDISTLVDHLFISCDPLNDCL